MNKIKFIDLFAGIGGFRIALENQGLECVFSSEINSKAQETYFNNFNEYPEGDITKKDYKEIPNFDILCAGFPCQPFSISGKKEGFNDVRGTLFFNIAEIIKEKKPSVILLENVKNFFHHDKGRTFERVKDTIEGLGYHFSYDILNAKDFGVPQNRERVFMVGALSKKFDFKKIVKKDSTILKDFLDKTGDFDILDSSEYTLLEDFKKQPSGLIFRGYRNKQGFKSGIRENTLHLSRVHRQPNRIYSSNGSHPTIPSQEQSGRFFIYDEDNKYVRKLTINECYRIMGYPNDFKKHKVISESYRQIGNSIVIPVVEFIIKEMINQEVIKRV